MTQPSVTTGAAIDATVAGAAAVATIASAMDSSEPPTPLIFTDSAAAKVADLIAEEGNNELKLRVFVQAAAAPVFNMVLRLMMQSMKTILNLKKMV